MWTDDQTIPGISSKGVSENFTLNGARSFYGATKLASELLIAEYAAFKGIRCVINRCGVLSGPWQMGKVDQGVVILWLARHYFKGKLAYIGYGGTGKQTRDVLHISDLVELIDHQIHHLNLFSGKTLNVGGGLDVSFSLQELTRLCVEITGNTIPIENILENRTADLRIYIGDNSYIQSVCGWKPTRNIRQLLEDSFQWIRENETILKNILT
jgi:CDP-paratose 2-epimerase